MTKRITIPGLLSIFLGILLFHTTLAQNSTIDLTFTADHFGYHIDLDSILIENITQGVDTTLYNPDTILTLLPIVGLSEFDEEKMSFSLCQNYPNPVINSTEVGINMFTRSVVFINLISLSGEILLMDEVILEKGRNIFTVYPGEHKFLIFYVSDGNSTQSIKMINNSSGKQDLKLRFKGCENAHSTYLKQDYFVFYFGDELRFTGYSTTPGMLEAYDLIIDSPYESTSYVFGVKEGTPCPDIPYLIYEGQLYNTVQIGSQCWMKENLNVGIMIDLVQQQSNNGIIEKYCYNNDSANCEIYGGMYQLNEALNNLCPDGWHVPTGDEWETLGVFLGGESIAGGKMKSPGMNFWNHPNTGATNLSGFSGLPGGNSYEGAPGTYHFWGLGLHGVFWSPTTYGSYGNGFWNLEHDTEELSMGTAFFGNRYSFSVRCIKD